MPATTHVPGTTVPVFEPISGWTVRATAGPVPDAIASRPVQAEVPGCVHTDLLAAGLIDDPYVGTVEADLTWLHRTDWRYEATLAWRPVAGERVHLVMQGLDTVATVRLNGDVVSESANQHRSYRVDVTDRLIDGANTVTVDLASALDYAEGMAARLGARPHVNAHPYNMVRKMACSFGWDWGPDLQTAGIWRPFGVERWRTARIAEVRPVVTVDDDGGHVVVHVRCERADDDVPLVLSVRVTGPGGEQVAGAEVPPGADSAVVEVDVPNPALWWPRGYGDQPLYDLDVELIDPQQRVIGAVHRRIGMRTVELDTSPDEHGTAFVLSVNGTALFARGANWIPDDHFVSRVDRDRLAERIDQAVGANLNLLRVWGGGLYESEDFYDLCDEAGLLVWQDFLFACAGYPESDPLYAEVEAEARENVVRLTAHPSLVVWNGANENMWQAFDWFGAAERDGIDWGMGYYTDLLPRIVAALDNRPYTLNSPYSPGFTLDEMHPNHPDHGTHHQWDCWNSRDWVHYRDDVPRFCSEFGWQGPPTWATLTRALAPEDRTTESTAFLLHQKAPDGTGKIDRGMAPHLPVPAGFEDWHWAAQLNQAKAVRFAIEHHRSWWPRTAGSVVWQLNDCWPVTSWAAVDGDGRPKPLWFALRDSFADRIVTVQPRGAVWVAVVVNDHDEVWEGELVAERTTLSGDLRARIGSHVHVAPRSVAEVGLPGHVLAPGEAADEVLVVTIGGRRAVHLFAEDRDVAYRPVPAAEVARVTGGYEVTVTASSLLRDLTVLADAVHPDARADQGLVTLLAGETATIGVRCPVEVDPGAFSTPRVLRSANDLVVGGF